MLIGHLINNLFSSFQLSREQQKEGASVAAHLNVQPVARRERGVAMSWLPAGWSQAGKPPWRQTISEGRTS